MRGFKYHEISSGKKGGLRNLDNGSLAFKETIDKIRLADIQATY
jgi:hypothetical protein